MSSAAAFQLWIDATRPASGWCLWGMSLVERQVREAGRRGLRRAQVWVSPVSEASVRRLRPDLHRLYDLEIKFGAGALADATDPALVLEGDVVYDERIIDHLLSGGPGRVFRGADGECAALIDAAGLRQLGRLASGDDVGLAALIARHGDELGLTAVDMGQIEDYISSLRLTMPPYMIRLASPERLPEVDRLMYRRTFKGVIDAVALYGYYHLVRWITRHISRTRLSPNFLTVLSILAIWAAVPLFLLDWHGWAIVAAWIGVILDSVDGKLARLRLHLSEAMGHFEHLAAMPGLGLWYLSIGWSLSGGGLGGGVTAVATWILLASYLLDKGLSGGFKALYGCELFDYRPVDAVFHLVACRRNIGLLIYTIGLLAGVGRESLYAIAAWMVVTTAFHALRFGWIAAADRPPRSRTEVEVRGMEAGS